MTVSMAEYADGPGWLAQYRGRDRRLRRFCADVLATYKHEVNSKSDYKSAGVKKHECEGKAHDPDDDEDEE